MNNFLYIRGLSNIEYEPTKTKCKNCNVKFDIVDFDELTNDKSNKLFSFDELYNILKKNIKLDKYNTIITSNISFFIILYILNDSDLLDKIENINIINLNSFIPYNIEEFNKLIFLLYKKNINLSKKFNKKLKILNNAFQESFEDIMNNLDNYVKNEELKNKITFTHVLSKENQKNLLSSKNKNLLKSIGNIKSSFKFIDDKIYNCIKNNINHIKNGGMLDSLSIFSGKKKTPKTEKPNSNLPLSVEDPNDNDNDNYGYNENKEIYSSLKLPESCNGKYDSKKEECSVDLGSHVQHTFNCYSYFLNLIHNDLIEHCINQTNDSNVNSKDRCRNLWPQPGDYSNFGLIREKKFYTCRNLVNRVLKDFPELKYVPTCKHQMYFTKMLTDIEYNDSNPEPSCDAQLINDKITPRYKDENTKKKNPIQIINNDSTFKCPKGYYKGALSVAPSETYHFYRKDKISKTNKKKLWTHKDGSSLPSTVDSIGQKIIDPFYANRNYSNVTYEDFCGYFCIPKNIKSKIPFGRYERIKEDE